MNFKTLLLTLMAAAAVLPASAAVEYWVSPRGNDANPGTEAKPFASVEAAVLSVRANTETIIHLQKDASFLVGSLKVNDNCQVTFIGDNTTLKAAEQRGLDGGEGNRILRGGANTIITVEGINFVNGRQVGYFPGGAIFFIGKQLTVNNCRFKGNEAGSAGGAIGSRGINVTVKNSYFEDNYILGGGGVGPAIMHAGNMEEAESALVVENCTFYNNRLEQGGGHANAIGIYDPTVDGGQFSVTTKVDVRNCTFVSNTNPQGYMATIDVSDNGDCETILVNNTFYNEEVGFRFRFHEAPLYMFNNFMYCTKSAVANDDMSVADTERSQIVGYNNILIGGELAVNAFVDDNCFNAGSAACNNTLGDAQHNPISNFAISTTLSNESVPYLTIFGASPLVNAGLSDTSAYTGGENFVLAYDCRNAVVNDTRDIGAFEFGADAGVANITVDNSNAPVEYFNLNGVRVLNPENGLYIRCQGTKVTKVIL